MDVTWVLTQTTIIIIAGLHLLARNRWYTNSRAQLFFSILPFLDPPRLSLQLNLSTQGRRFHPVEFFPSFHINRVGVVRPIKYPYNFFPNHLRRLKKSLFNLSKDGEPMELENAKIKYSKVIKNTFRLGKIYFFLNQIFSLYEKVQKLDIQNRNFEKGTWKE